MSRRGKFLSWYETVAKTEVFDISRLLERYCQDDVTAARGVPYIPQALSTDGQCRSVSRKYDNRIGLQQDVQKSSSSLTG
jgi:hypothetical protein